jgi:hypothetical protein
MQQLCIEAVTPYELILGDDIYKAYGECGKIRREVIGATITSVTANGCGKDALVAEPFCRLLIMW